MDPLVSVVIPSYNSAPWLEETIASVRAQTWRQYEIIIVDDGSTDGSGDLAERISGADMRVVRQANAGQCAALNRGMREAQGEFTQYLGRRRPDRPGQDRYPDGPAARAAAQVDRIVLRARFESKAAEARVHPGGGLAGPSPGRLAGRLLVRGRYDAWRGLAHSGKSPARLARGTRLLTLVNDLDYFSRLLLASDGIGFCPAARTFYRSNVSGSLSRQVSRSAWISAFEATRLSSDARFWPARIHRGFARPAPSTTSALSTAPTRSSPTSLHRESAELRSLAAGRPGPRREGVGLPAADPHLRMEARAARPDHRPPPGKWCKRMIAVVSSTVSPSTLPSHDGARTTLSPETRLGADTRNRGFRLLAAGIS